MKNLYDLTPLTTDFTAEIISCTPIGNGKYSVTLSQTAFFPGGGGQECDTGYIAGTRVTSAKLSNGDILHITDTPLTTGGIVKCSVDREARLSRMASHTGEHIVSALMHRNFGFSNVGFHMGSEDVTADFDGVIDAAQLAAVEAEANAVIRANLPVTVSYPNAASLSAMDYRSKLNLTGDVRIVSIGDLDKCACCAPHMPETGMVGMIVFTGFQHWKGGIRAHMLCGADAVSFCRSAIDRSDVLCRLLSSKPGKLVESVSRLAEENASLKKALSAMNSTVNSAIISCISETGRPIVLRDERSDIAALRSLAVDAYRKSSAPVCVIGSSGRFVIAGENLTPGFARLSTLSNVRGGGSDSLICGSSEEDISNAFISAFEA